jgi:hypothetical protein
MLLDELFTSFLHDLHTNVLTPYGEQFSYLLVDEMHAAHPELIRDQYWDEVDFELPYTAANAVKTPEQMTFAMGSADAVT